MTCVLGLELPVCVPILQHLTSSHQDRNRRWSRRSSSAVWWSIWLSRCRKIQPSRLHWPPPSPGKCFPCELANSLLLEMTEVMPKVWFLFLSVEVDDPPIHRLSLIRKKKFRVGHTDRSIPNETSSRNKGQKHVLLTSRSTMPAKEVSQLLIKAMSL